MFEMLIASIELVVYIKIIIALYIKRNEKLDSIRKRTLFEKKHMYELDLLHVKTLCLQRSPNVSCTNVTYVIFFFSILHSDSNAFCT